MSLLKKDLNKETLQLNSIFENAAVLLMLLNSEQKVVNINKAGLLMIGKKKEAVIGLPGGSVLDCADGWKENKVTCGTFKHCENCVLRNSVRKTLVTRQSNYKIEGELSVLRGDKYDKLAILVSTSPVKIEQENFVLMTIEDVTQLKRQEQELKELIATRDKFFGIIAHDLRNPFTSILGVSEVLLENGGKFDQENIQKFTKILNESAKSSYALLENLLEWSRAQTGNIKFCPENLRLADLVRENLVQIKTLAGNKNITTEYKVDESLEVYADKNMIHTILRNLLSNAVKFTKEGGNIFVSAQKGEGLITISVKDNGIGIEQENIPKLFRIDQKILQKGTAEEKGTGLGLILCKEFVEKHGGMIWVESEPDKGSEFKFTLPV